MSCSGCKKRRTYNNIVELAKKMVESEKQPYVIVDNNDTYDFIPLEYAISTGKKYIKVLQYT